MNCKCNWADLIAALVILLVTIWPAILGADISKWAIILGAVFILVHAVIHPHNWVMKSSKKK